MFDTMTITKALGAVCGSLLIYLFGAWAAESLYHVGAAGHGEGMEQAYSIDTGEAAGGEVAVEEGPAFAEVFAAADPVAGEKTFAKCKSCHKIDGGNGTGPHLDGVVDRAKGAVEGFKYSEGLLGQASETWTAENLNTFLTSPKAYVPGTKMSFQGLPKVEDRANVIAYLASLK